MPYRPRTVLKVLIALALITPVVASCTTAPKGEPEIRPLTGSAEQYRQHRIKQQQRFEAGNYKRIYRPKQCRSPLPDCRD